MDKLKMESADITQRNIKRLEKLFPNVITEMKDKNGKLKNGINFELLKQELSEDVIDGEECYEFTWVGKKKAIIESNTSVRKTLKPCIEQSKNWENTENIYIEGDNLDALKILQKSYLNSIKMIYIDPPYNTGNDFIYKDDFAVSKKEYNERIGILNKNKKQLFTNAEASGRLHSDWCSMIYPRLKLAQDLLSNDGVILISIDDKEVDNLKKICNEIFGESNFIAQCVRKRRNSQANLSKNISPIHEYLVIYAKANGEVLNRIEPDINEDSYKNPDNDVRGPYVTMPCTNKGGAVYSIKTPTGKTIKEEWRFKEETYYKLLSDNRIIFPRSGNGKPRYKLFLSKKKKSGVLANTWLDNVSSNQEATREIKELFNEVMFDTPKPTGLIKFCLKLAANKDSVVLDFFSGSATTADAVMQLNAEDGGNRKFIMIQLPEATNEKSKAYKASYKNICEIGKERIRRAGEKIKARIEECNAEIKPGKQSRKLPDIGFRVLKVDSTDMKEDRTDQDLLYEVILELGLSLSLKYKIEEVERVNIYIVDEDSLIACFAENISENVAREIAKRKPLYAVFSESSFKNSGDKINVEKIFEFSSPNTSVKVI